MPITKPVKGANRLLSCQAMVLSRIYTEPHFIMLMTFAWLYSLRENLPLGQNQPSSLPGRGGQVLRCTAEKTF